MDKLIYTKYSTDRDKSFAIRTDRLRADGGEEIINKVALYDEGVSHLEHMVLMAKKLQDRYSDKIKIAASTLNGKVLTNEFVAGEPFYNSFEETLEEGDKEAVKATLSDYRDMIYYSDNGEKDFAQTSEFKEVFGDYDSLEGQGLLAAEVTDIDMILENIIVADDGTWQLIDYEWTYDFPIPREYVLYRTLMYLYVNSKIGYVFDWNDALEWAGISKGLEDTFGKMERHFQEYITKNRLSVEGYINDNNIAFIPISTMAHAYNMVNGDTSEYAMARKEVGDMHVHYNALAREYNMTVDKFNHYKSVAEKNSTDYNTLKDAYVMQQVELDTHREASKYGRLKRFLKR